jgi:hypothetical protein
VAGAAAAAAAVVTVVVTLVAAGGPAPDRAPVGTVDPAPTTGRTPPFSVPPEDVLTPGQEAELVERNGAALAQAYTPPPGWRILRREGFTQGWPGNDRSWDAAVVITDSADHLVTLYVGLASGPPGGSFDGCDDTGVPRPPGVYTSTDSPPAVTVCRRLSDLSISVSAWPGGPGAPYVDPTEPPQPGRTHPPLPPQPETARRLTALVTSPLFGWPR